MVEELRIGGIVGKVVVKVNNRVRNIMSREGEDVFKEKVREVMGGDVDVESRGR